MMKYKLDLFEMTNEEINNEFKQLKKQLPNYCFYELHKNGKKMGLFCEELGIATFWGDYYVTDGEIRIISLREETCEIYDVCKKELHVLRNVKSDPFGYRFKMDLILQRLSKEIDKQE